MGEHLRADLPILERAYLLADEEGDSRLAADLAGIALRLVTEARLLPGKWPERVRESTERADRKEREDTFSDLLDQKKWDLAQRLQDEEADQPFVMRNDIVVEGVEWRPILSYSSKPDGG